MRAMKVILLMAGLAVMLAHVGCASDAAADKQAALNRGNAYAEQGKVREAIIEYRRAIQIDSAFGEARLRLSDMYRRTGDVPRAYLEIIRAADLLSDNVDLQIEAGRWLLAAGRFEEARNRADQVLQRSPNHARAHILRGNALARLKDLYTALEDMEKAVAAAPDEGLPYAGLAVVQFARGEEEAAEDAFRKALTIEPRDPIVRLAYTNYLLALRRFADAEEQLKEAAALEPDDVLVARALAGFYMLTRQTAMAEPYLKRLAAADNSAASFALARLYVALDRDEDAVGVLTTLAARPDTAAEAKLQLAAIRFSRQQSADAYRLVEEVVANEVDRPRALLLKSGFLLADNRPADAVAAARAALEANPVLAQGYFVLGLGYAALGRFDEGRAAFDAELRLEPRDVRALVGLSFLELASGDVGRAREFADKAASVAPTAPAVRAAVLRVALELGHLDRAEYELRGIRAAGFNTADSYLLEGRLRLAQKNRPAARAAFTNAAEIDSKSLDAATELIQLDLAEGRVRAARTRADQLLTRMPDDAPTLLLVGRTYATSNDFATAEKRFREALAADPSMTAAYAALGGIYLRQGRSTDALKEFQALAAASPQSITAHTMVAALLEAYGRRADAKQAYRKVLEIDAGAVVASNNLAWLMLEDGENIDQALHLAQTARSRLPGSPDVADTIGWIYYKKGLYSLAVTALREAVQKQPSNADFLYHLGLASARSGDDQLARQSLERALKLSPQSNYASEAQLTLPRLRGKTS